MAEGARASAMPESRLLALPSCHFILFSILLMMTGRYQGFERLSSNVHLHTPPTNDGEGAKHEGPLIILCTWMSAVPKLVARYADRFVSEFPKSSIVLITISVSDFVRLSETEWSERVAPAIDVILASAPGRSLHACAYSNGGAQALVQLARTYHARTHHALPIKKLVLDSAPGSPEITVSHRAMLLSINPPKWSYPLAWPLLWVYLGLMWIYMIVCNVENPVEGTRQRLNDPQLFETAKSERVYIYSKEDQMVPWDWVEASARLAEKKGWNTKLELFKGSKHVAHAALDKERYWAIVRQTIG